MSRATAGINRLAMAITACVVLCGSEDSCDGNHSVHSTNVATGSMSADITARAIGNGRTHVRVKLESGNGQSDVDLSGGDRLVAKHIDPTTLREQTKDLVEQENLDAFAYTGTFNNQEKDYAIEVAFDRSATGRASANGSVLAMPTPFELDWVEDPVSMSAAPKSFSRSSATPYFVTWDPFDALDFEPGDVLSYDVFGNCIQPFSGAIDWPGGGDALQLTGVLQDQAPPRDGLSCRLHAVISLRRTGVIDPAFASGSFVGKQVRELHLESTP